jgi:elongation factor P
MERAALAIAKDAGEIDDAALARGQQLFHGEFGRGVEIAPGGSPVGSDKFGREAVEMRLVARRDLQDRGVHLDESLSLEIAAQRRDDPVPRHKQRPPVGVAVFGPEGQGLVGSFGLHEYRWRSAAKSSICPPGCGDRPTHNRGKRALKVIASQVRKGNVLEADGQLYVVLSAENFHPGKGTPTTQIDMRRISDGVKVSQRYKTTEQVERAFIDEQDFQYLYQDGDSYTFMNGETFDQVSVPKDVIGDQAAYLQENMTVHLSLHEGVPVAIELPQRVTLEVVDTEPAMKGQTAASSYKPAKLSNGVRTNVPPHIAPGTRIVVMTADGSYVERAKD